MGGFIRKDRLETCKKIIKIIEFFSINLSANTTRFDLEMLFMAMLNAFGIILIVLGLGYGAVAIPRRLIKFSNCKVKQKYCEYTVGKLTQQIEDNYYNLETEYNVKKFC